MRRLYEHQRLALARCVGSARWALYMEQRLGKTLPALRGLVFRRALPALIVAPYSALHEWAVEAQSEGIPYVTAFGAMAERAEALQHAAVTGGLCLLNWQALSRMRAHIERANTFRACIIDESRTISNPGAAVTLAALRLSETFPTRGLLSGAPATEGLHEYYTQMRFLGDTWDGLSFWDWRNKWFRQTPGAYHGGAWYPTTEGERYITSVVAQYAFALRRSDTVFALPHEHTECRIPADAMGALWRNTYNTAENDYVFERPGAAAAEAKLTSWAGQRYVWLRRIANGVGENGDIYHTAKLDQLDWLLYGELRSRPVIVWCAYVTEVEAVAKLVQSRRRMAMPVHGAIPHDMRNVRIDLWRRSDNGVLIATPETIRYGADLSASDTVVWFSVPASLDVYQQAQERTRKIGVHSKTFSIVLVMENTVDEDVWMALQEKDSNALRAHELLKRAAKRRQNGGAPSWWVTAQKH